MKINSCNEPDNLHEIEEQLIRLRNIDVVVGFDAFTWKESIYEFTKTSEIFISQTEKCKEFESLVKQILDNIKGENCPSIKREVYTFVLV